MDVILAVIGHTAAGSAQSERRADDGGQADFLQLIQRDLHTGVQIGAAILALGRGHDGGFGVLKTQTIHRLAEQGTVFGHFDGVALGADHLNAEFFKHAHLFQRQRGVQPGLPAHCGQQGVGALFLDDLGDNLGGDRLDIRRIGQAGVGHDGGRI